MANRSLSSTAAVIKAAVFAGMMLATAAQAEAPPQCGSHDVAVTALTRNYGEILQATGEVQGGVVEMWGNPHTHTWTLMAVNPVGIACIIATGVNLVATLGEPT